MKVTVSFDATKILVPVGAGDISVRELTALAATRFKRALAGTGQRDIRLIVKAVRYDKYLYIKYTRLVHKVIFNKNYI